QSLAIREEIGDRMGVGRIRGMLSLLYMDRAEYDRAYASAEQALAIALETEDRLFEGTALSQLGEIAWRSGDLADASSRFKAAEAVFSSIDDGMRALQTIVRRARVALLDERYEDAAALATDVHARSGTDVAFAQPNIEALELLGEIAHTQGEYERAANYLQEVLATVSTMSWDRKRARILALLGTVEMDRGRPGKARAMVGQLLELPQTPYTLKVRARLAFEEGDVEQARSLMREAKEEAGASWSSDDDEILRRYVDAAA
ncbi:MAG: tetratricopeptide repeat protein, partial [Pseudomonadota bacterium]